MSAGGGSIAFRRRLPLPSPSVVTSYAGMALLPLVTLMHEPNPQALVVAAGMIGLRHVIPPEND